MYVPHLVHIAKTFWKYPTHAGHLVRNKIKSHHRYSWALKNPDKDGQVPPPLTYKLYLNQACDLRCPMCFLWGETGIYTSGDKVPVPRELDWKIIEKIFQQTSGQKPLFILSGGEPLLYSRFKHLAGLLKESRSCAYICTNGGHIDKHLDVIEGNPYLIFYISLDGTKETNALLRGRGVYDKVVNNIKKLKSLRPGPYVGIQFTLQPENVNVLYDTCREMVGLGVDWILINLRWNVSERQARDYEKQLQEDFGVKAWNQQGYVTASYAVDTKEFMVQCARIKAARWPIYISSYLRKPEDLDAYINDEYKNPYNNFCYKQWARMDVLSDGQVTPCMPYPDLRFDSLADKSIMEIWNGEPYRKFRQYRRKKSFSVCSKCDCLYLYDKERSRL
ncbi:MAG: radical SAM protein [Candidatus Omnitrophica bacterium]|nr:radical SAM protein [Candidatus Omnitrophota bacterium]MDE2223391.1 radical SAM protein [Candidatus Omnitrophota bacterium]